MIVCTVSDLGLSFGADEIFRGLTFSVSEGDRVGIIGVNGVGKSSLFRCITGEYTPTSGQVFLAGSTTVGMLAQDTDLSYLGDMTLADYVLSAFPELTALEGEIARTVRRAIYAPVPCQTARARARPAPARRADESS